MCTTVIVHVTKDCITWRNEKNELHRVDEPAVVYAYGSKTWYLNDQRHSVDGPAAEYANGDKYWFLHGCNYSEEDFYKALKELQCKR